MADHRDLLSAAEACGGVVQKLSAEQRLWKRLCRFHFTPVQISFALSEIQKEREKPHLNVTLNKNNRSSRTPHPYLNPRRSPVRSHDADSSKPEEVLSTHTDKKEISIFRLTSKYFLFQLLDNVSSSTDTRGRVSSAFHEHLKRHRENLLSLQNEAEQESSHQQQVINANHSNRLVSFQDVRNHFDQREMLDNEPRSPRTNQQLPPKRKNNEKDDCISPNNQSNLETDWEDVFHRARR